MIRPTFHGKPEDLDLTLDECVEQQRDECMNAIETLTKYFCGIDEYCSPKNNFVHKKDATGKIRITTDLGKAAKAAEQAKKNIVQQYFTIGVLEHFDATLQLFEKMLPSVFTGATEAYNSECKYSPYFYSACPTTQNSKSSDDFFVCLKQLKRVY